GWTGFGDVDRRDTVFFIDWRRGVALFPRFGSCSGRMAGDDGGFSRAIPPLSATIRYRSAVCRFGCCFVRGIPVLSVVQPSDDSAGAVCPIEVGRVYGHCFLW